MLQNILNLDGVTVLNKKQQKVVSGGLVQETTCKFTLFGTENGQSTSYVGYESSPISGSGSSSWANDVCAHAVSTNSNVNRCFYDCDYDGYGQ